MNKITLSVFVAICFIGATYGTKCSAGPGYRVLSPVQENRIPRRTIAVKLKDYSAAATKRNLGAGKVTVIMTMMTRSQSHFNITDSIILSPRQNQRSSIKPLGMVQPSASMPVQQPPPPYPQEQYSKQSLALTRPDFEIHIFPFKLAPKKYS